jgi:hypothetical protein
MVGGLLTFGAFGGVHQAGYIFEMHLDSRTSNVFCGAEFLVHFTETQIHRRIMRVSFNLYDRGLFTWCSTYEAGFSGAKHTSQVLVVHTRQVLVVHTRQVLVVLNILGRFYWC